MKRDVFAIIVVVFTLFSAFVFYLDSSRNCGSLPCVSSYISTGEVKNTEYRSDSLIDKIIYPFVNPVSERGPLFQPGPADPPLPPTGLNSFTLNDTSLFLGWADQSPDETGFNLEFKLSSDTTWTTINLAANTNNYLHTGLAPATSYDYRILAFNAFGPSPYSGPITASTRPTPVVSSMAPLSVYNNVDNWITVTGGTFLPGFSIDVKTLAGNWIQRCIDGDGNCVFGDSGTVSFKIFAGTPAQNYEFAYREYSIGGPVGALSNPTTIAVLPLVIPVIDTISPSNVAQNIDRTVTLTGTGFEPSYTLFITDPAFSFSALYCTEIPNANCNRVSDTQFEFNVPQGFPAGDFLFVYVNNIYLTNSLPITLTVTPTACLDGQRNQPCLKQNGVCSGSTDTCVNGIYPGCTDQTYLDHSTAYSPLESGVAFCLDDLDNDCDIEYDYDGTLSVRGDNGCPVGATGITAPLSVSVGNQFTLQCPYTPGNVRSAEGSINGVDCSFSSWSGNTASFNCVAPLSVGTYPAVCGVNTAYSYQSGNDQPSDVSVVPGTCSGYTDSSSCNAASGGNTCEWCIGCQSNPGQSSGGPDRCVNAGTCAASYQCIVNQCGATCSGSSSCSSSQACNLNSCGCIEQDPVITDVNPPSFAWSGTGIVVSVTGNYFANNAQLFVNGDQITPISNNGNTLSFSYVPESFGVGPNSVVVVNPTSSRSSVPDTLTTIVNPTIDRLIPNVITNNVLNTIQILGDDFDPASRVFADGVLDLTSLDLTNWVNRTLIELEIPAIPAALDYSISVRAGDGTISNSQNLRLNALFDYVLGIDFSVAPMKPGEVFSSTATIESPTRFMVQEIVSISADTPAGFAVSFVGTDNCMPDDLLSPPSCEVDFNITTIGNLALGQYNISFDSVSSVTGVMHQVNVTIDIVEGYCGDNICNATIGEVCNACTLDCGTCPAPPGGSSGGGGGGGGGGGARPVLQQCNDKKDNDGDGAIDYPTDTGCSSLTDSTELDASSLVNSNYTLGDEIPDAPQGETEGSGVKIVFWAVLVILVAGIVVASVVIVRSLMQKKKFKTLSSLISSSSASKTSAVGSSSSFNR